MSGLATVYRPLPRCTNHEGRASGPAPRAGRSLPGPALLPGTGRGDLLVDKARGRWGAQGRVLEGRGPPPPGAWGWKAWGVRGHVYPLPARVSGLHASLCVRTDAFRKPHSVWHPGGTRRGPCPSGDAPCASHGGPAAISGNLVTSRAEELCPVSRKYTCTRTRTHTGTCVHALRYDRKHIFNSINVA